MKVEIIIAIIMTIVLGVMHGYVGADIHSDHSELGVKLDDPVYVNYNDDVDKDIKDACWEFSQYMPAYMEDEVDCDDMAVYLWNKLQEKGVKTILVVGMLDGEYTPFNKCNHVWLRCMTPDGGITIEPTIPAVIYSNGYYTFSSGYYKSHFNEDPNMDYKYHYGFYYAKPSDMRADLGDRW